MRNENGRYLGPQARALLLGCALLAAAAPVAAQTSAPPAPLWIEPGSRVRLVADVGAPARLAATLVALTPDSMYLASSAGGHPFAVPLSSVRELRVHMKTSPALGARNGARWGAFLGASLGLIGGGLAARSLPFGLPAAVAIGGTSGALVGAGTGALFFPEQWRRYRLVHDSPVAQGSGPDR